METEFMDIEVSKGNVKVVLEYIGEGFQGDYDPENPLDEPLVRFTIYQNDEQVEDASYCTALSIHTERTLLKDAANTIMKEVYPELEAGNSIKKLCENLSYIQV